MSASLLQAPSPQAPAARVVVIGACIIGLAAAWWLQRCGHAVVLVDPASHGPQPEGSGSSAALGVLMGEVFHRSSGRAWQLRQQSLQLWQQWCAELATAGQPVPHRQGLLLLAASAQEQERLEALALNRQALGMAMELWQRPALEALCPALPRGALAGLFSPRDGQLDPLAAMAAFRHDGQARGLELRADRVAALERRNGRWHLSLQGGGGLEAPWVLVAAGLASPALLAPLGHERPLEPVLGQAAELEVGPELTTTWPASVVWRGINLVPRPQRRLWLGATLEPGLSADPARWNALRQLEGEAPEWLAGACVLRRWQGLRARPVGRPAPLLEQLEPGLLLLSGHYRNGVLLAPASAAWAAELIATASP